VVADNGKVLSNGMSENSGSHDDRTLTAALERRVNLTRQHEQTVEMKVQGILDKMYGPGKSVVKVAVDLDFTQKQTKTTLYAPPADPKGALAPSYKEKVSERSSSGGGDSTLAMGGLPGTTSNTPGASSYGLVNGKAYSSGGMGNLYERSSEQSRNGIYSRNDVLTEDEVGTVKRLSITALIQGLTADRVAALTQIVAATAGADTLRRGDTVVVQGVTFDTSAEENMRKMMQEDDKPNRPNPKKDNQIPLPVFIGIGVATLFGAALLAFIRMNNRREDTDFLAESLGDMSLPQEFNPGLLEDDDFGLSTRVPQSQNNPMAQAGFDDGPFSFLEEYEPESIAQILNGEKSIAVAGVLASLNPSIADMVLGYLDPDIQDDVFNRLQNPSPMPGLQQRSLAQSLRRKIGIAA
jgi:flagellar biosynthesis/type III secretory pathway M-ring protein FliF/YscJ